jgi:hypothetical protein
MTNACMDAYMSILADSVGPVVASGGNFCPILNSCIIQIRVGGLMPML